MFRFIGVCCFAHSLNETVSKVISTTTENSIERNISDAEAIVKISEQDGSIALRYSPDEVVLHVFYRFSCPYLLSLQTLSTLILSFVDEVTAMHRCKMISGSIHKME
jgi:hypothetical protein